MNYIREVKFKINSNIEILLTNSLLNKTELPSKLLEQIAFNTRPEIEEHMLIVMDKSTHEDHLSQALQTNIKQFKIAVTFLTGYNGIFNVITKVTNFISRKQLTTQLVLSKLLNHQVLTK